MGLFEIAAGVIVSFSFLIGYAVYYLSKEEIDAFRTKMIDLTAPGVAMFIGLFIMPVLQTHKELILVLLAVGIIFGLFTADIKQNFRNTVISLISFFAVYFILM